MENKKYKLVAIDIDGTLLKSDETLSKKTIDIIKRCEENDIKVCLCTGRNVHNTKKIAKTLSKNMPSVCADGTILFDANKNKAIKMRNIEKEVLKELVLLTDKYHLYMEFCSPHNYFKYLKSDDLAKFNYGGVPKSVSKKLEDFFLKNVRYIKDLNKFIESDKLINQFLIGGEKDALDKLKNDLSNKTFDSIDIRYDLWDEYIFIVPKDSNKSYGLNLLSEHFGIDISDMIAIGDQMNDIDMIKNAGLGIAMGNANPKIKEVAKFITKTNDEDGVCFAIEKFIFNEVE